MAGSRVYFPMMADISGSLCVVVGGGPIGWRKASALLQYGANVVVVAPEAVPAVAAAADEGRLIWRRRAFRTADLEGAALVFAATNDPGVNADVCREAKERGIGVNAAYDGDQGSFIMPSVVRRGKLVMTVSTGGASPKLARQIAAEWEARYGPEYEAYVELLDRQRKLVLESGADEERKLRCLGELLSLKLLERIRGGELLPALEAELEEWRKNRLFFST